MLSGWRPGGTAVSLLAASGLLLLFGYAMLWLFAMVGLRASSAEAAQAATFPLIFASSIFVPVGSMPGWLQPFAENQPTSVTATAVRALTSGAPVGNTVWQSIAWSVGLIVVMLPLAARAYRSTSR